MAGLVVGNHQGATVVETEHDETRIAEATLELDVEHALDPRSVDVGRLGGIVPFLIVWLPASAGVALATITVPWHVGLKLGLVAAYIGLSGLGATLCYLGPAWRYRYTRYRVDQLGLTIRRGIYWRSVTVVPKSRVQHIDVLQGPVQRRFELATLVVHTAGTHSASISLGGLSHTAALSLRDFLIDRDHRDGI